MNMLRASLFMLMLTGCAAAQAAETKCFLNAGLKDQHRISFKLEAKRVSAGAFAIERGYDAAATEVYDFTGTRAGNVLTIRFTSQAPAELPQNVKTHVWKLVSLGDTEILKVTIYGKNFETNSYAAYTADYESCEPSQQTLMRSATRVRFAGGSTNATVLVSLTSHRDRKAFLLKLQRGRQTAVQAPGCGITFYYPDGSQYEEGTAIDVLGAGSLKQSGDYLFVISPAGEPGQCPVTFNVNR